LLGKASGRLGQVKLLADNLNQIVRLILIKGIVFGQSLSDKSRRHLH